ncbi:AAA family ATPase [Flavobacterium sp. UBA7680]|uniref:AAA family ATPase n=1 Tax=Flavobacterium sp. UBA7680 TaxID=1946559 RepID=UPI0025C49E1B|nr:AAA family ATPase [Flavobacterium sp. UBA7680]
MNEFKLIAIRPLIGCDVRFSKNLVLGKIYKFYNDYIFLDKNGKEVEKDEKVFKVDYLKKVPYELYKISTIGNNIVNINISAVVGKNGSGKSNLLEFFYLVNYLIAKINEVLYDKDIEISKNLAFEIYYSFQDVICLISYDPKNGLEFKKQIQDKFEIEDFKLEKLFYTVAINYSMYGLNSKNSGKWLDMLFHKNDGYQTPIVINPFRKEGNIDVNSETHLAQSRLMLNVLDLIEEKQALIDNKFVEEFDFVIDPSSLELITKSYPISINNIFNEFIQKESITIIDFFNQIYSIVNGHLDQDQIDNMKIKFDEDIKKDMSKHAFIEDEKVDYNEILFLFIKYSVRKVFKICYQYEDYSSYVDVIKKDKAEIGQYEVFSIKNLGELFEKIKKDKSHITLKLYQALYTIKNNYFKTDSWKVKRSPVNSTQKNYFCKQDNTAFQQRINTAITAIGDDNTWEKILLVPNALVKPSIIIRDEISKKNIDFNTLSSGEQQLTHSIQSILYHLKNLNSVFYSEGEKISYKNINLVLDEIELYYHPEYQRKFINYLLKAIEKLKIENIKGINIIFSTHSPFILSDIPNQNIMRLIEGEPQKSLSSDKTFGANIHDLLASDFFLKNGFMGEFAHEYITNLIDDINGINKIIPNDEFYAFLKKIEIIDEPFIRYKLIETLENKKNKT